MNHTPNQNPNRRPQQNGAPRPATGQSGQRPNLPPNMTPQQKAEYFRRLEAQRRAEQQRHGNEQRPKYRKRKRSKPNIGLILFAVIILIVVGVSIWYISTHPADTGRGNDLTDLLHGAGENVEANLPDDPDGAGETGGAEGVAPPFETEGDSAVPETSVPHDIHTANNADLDKGELILVNYQYAYALADTVSTLPVAEHKTDSYVLSTNLHRLSEPTIAAVNAMAGALAAETGTDVKLNLVSTYRTVADQQSIWDKNVQESGEEYARNYVASPGHSEHHTGMAIDFSFFRPADGASIPVAEYEHGIWLTEHCAEYGFILRYPDHKVDITRISYEPWHFRYVGAPHAAVITKADLCFEEYVGLLKDYTFDGKLLHALPDGTIAEVKADALPDEGYVIYYVPAAEGETTDVKIPAGYGNYTVSGNNADGFIVTVYVGQ